MIKTSFTEQTQSETYRMLNKIQGLEHRIRALEKLLEKSGAEGSEQQGYIPKTGLLQYLTFSEAAPNL